MSRGSASAQSMEAEPPDMRYQALPGNEYNHLELLYHGWDREPRVAFFFTGVRYNGSWVDYVDNST